MKTDGYRRWLMGLLFAWAVAAAAPSQPLPVALDEAGGSAPAGVDWTALNEAQRAQLRLRYRAWRALQGQERAELRRAQAQLAALPPAQQQALRQRFAAQDRLYRDGWRLGPALGAQYPQLQPLIGYVPAAQREALLGVLRALDAQQLRQLAVLAQRTPPQQRETLRNELLAQTPATRSAWLQRQLEAR